MARRPVRRNLAARSPLMRKGGVHLKSRSSKRHLLEDQLDDALEEWLEEQANVSEERDVTDDRGD